MLIKWGRLYIEGVLISFAQKDLLEDHFKRSTAELAGKL